MTHKGIITGLVLAFAILCTLEGPQSRVDALFASNYGRCPSLAHFQNVPSQYFQKLEDALVLVDSAMRNTQQQMRTPGVAVAIVLGSEVIYSQGFGYADKETKKEVNGLDTLFRIGSISKVFSALWMLKARDDGVVHPDEVVSTRVPQFSVKNPFLAQGKRGITFQQLASHMSGLPRSTPCSNCKSITPDEAWARVANLTLMHPPGARPLYSNCGFNVLGNALAHVYNVNFTTYMTENIFKPIGMSSTGVNVTQAPASRMATPYNPDGSVCHTCLADYGWASPSGSFYSSCGDLAKLMRMLLAEGPQGPSQLLDGTTIRESFSPRYMATDRESGFGTPWEMYYFNDYLLRTKEGDVGGFSGEIIMVPELKLGIAVLANMMFHAASYAEAVTAVLLPPVDTVMRMLKALPYIPPDWKEYIGEYKTDGGVDVTITGGEIQGRRYLTFNSPSLGVSAAMVSHSATHFQLLPAPEDQESCIDISFGSYFEYVDFVRNGSSVTGLRLPGLVYEATWTKQ